MDNLQILKIVKCKLFEPRKKIIFDTDGKKMLVDSTSSWFSERQHLTQEDLKLLEEREGWNLADKDYVDFKISELSKISPVPSSSILLPTISASRPSASLPSAPPAPPAEIVPSKRTRTVFFSPGNKIGDIVAFFTPGLVMKKGWMIVEFTIFHEIPNDNELCLTIKNMIDSKGVVVSKFKNNNKHILTADTKFKIDTVKAAVFELGSDKRNDSKGGLSLQITVEM